MLWLLQDDKHKRITISSQACLQTIYNIITASGLWTYPHWILTRPQVAFFLNAHTHRRAHKWIKHCAIYMMYSLKIHQHLTFRSNTNTRESERGRQNSLFLISGKTMQVQKNLIEKLHECKLSLVGARWMLRTTKRRRGGIRLISTWVTLLLQYGVWPSETEGRKTFALGNERGELQRGQWYPTNGGYSLGLITLKHTQRQPGERLCQQVLWK